MRHPSLVVLGVFALAASASAGLNRAYMVPVYDACPGSGNCSPPTRSSSFTFDSIVLSSSPQQYTGPGKFALAITVKGLKDATGAPATGTLELRVAPGRVTILSQGVGTLGETSPFLPNITYPVHVQNGSGRARFKTPDDTPANGLVTNSLETPILYDPDGKALASTGTQSKP
jgi:hypothetical protein